MTWRQRIAFLQDWLRENAGILGVPIALLSLVIILAALSALRPRPTGPAEEIGGRIISETRVDPQYYNETRVVVELVDGVRFTTGIPLAQTCRVGDRALVARRKAGGGRDHRLLSCTKDDGPRQAG